MLAVAQGRVGMLPRALDCYLSALQWRETRQQYLGDLLWLAAVRGLENADDIMTYSRFCARLDGHVQREKTGAEILNSLLAGMKGESAP